MSSEIGFYVCSHPIFCPQNRSWPPDLCSLEYQVPSRLPPLHFALEIGTATWLSLEEETVCRICCSSLLLSGVCVETQGQPRGLCQLRVKQGSDHLHAELKAPGIIQQAVFQGLSPTQARFKNFSAWKVRSFRISAQKWLWFGAQTPGNGRLMSRCPHFTLNSTNDRQSCFVKPLPLSGWGFIYLLASLCVKQGSHSVAKTDLKGTM